MANKKQYGEGYEASDVRTNIITVFLTAVAGMTVLGLIVVVVLMRGLGAYSAKQEESVSPLRTPQSQLPEPGTPLLQQDPVAERKAIVAAAEAQLHSYGIHKEVGVENGADIVHIPIARAIELVGTGKATYRQAPTVAALEEANGGEAVQ
jgi:hypothetical protein